MRITFRLIVSLISGVTLVALLFTYLEVKEEKHGMREELERRGFRNATLWVLASNDRARRFYEREGWEADGATKVDEFGTVEMREVRYARRLGGRPDS